MILNKRMMGFNGSALMPITIAPAFVKASYWSLNEQASLVQTLLSSLG